MENMITRSTLLEYLEGGLTTAEKKAVEQWCHASEENRRMFIEIQNEYLQMQWGVQASMINGNFSTVRKRLNLPVRKSRRKTIVAISISSAAAIIAVVMILRGLDFSTKNDFSAIARTDNMPILEMSNGDRHVIDGNETILIEKNGITMSFVDGVISYEKTDNEVPCEIIYNKIIIPRGAESCRIKLSDGSVVWLNSDSSLEYPLNFADIERRVLLTGEAYFDVVKDDAKQFVVESGGQSVAVLGTEFNISGYPQEPVVTTLVSGMVQVRPDHNDNLVILSPGQQTIFNVASGTIGLTDVRVADFISWKEGKISIEKNTFRQALTKISRKFDVEFDISDPDLESRILRGSIPADEDLDTILYILQKAVNVEFKLKKNGEIKVVKN